MRFWLYLFVFFFRLSVSSCVEAHCITRYSLACLPKMRWPTSGTKKIRFLEETCHILAQSLSDIGTLHGRRTMSYTTVEGVINSKRWAGEIRMERRGSSLTDPLHQLFPTILLGGCQWKLYIYDLIRLGEGGMGISWGGSFCVCVGSDIAVYTYQSVLSTFFFFFFLDEIASAVSLGGLVRVLCLSLVDDVGNETGVGVLNPTEKKH